MTATLSLSFQKASFTIEYPCVVTASSGEDGIILSAAAQTADAEGEGALSRAAT